MGISLHPCIITAETKRSKGLARLIELTLNYVVLH